MAQIHGTIVREIDGCMCFRVLADRGEAQAYRLAGEIWISRRQCRRITEAAVGQPFDIIEVDDAIAAAFASPALLGKGES